MFHFLYNNFKLQYIILRHVNHQITNLKPSQINQFPFIYEICYGYQNIESHGQNDENQQSPQFVLNYLWKICSKNIRQLFAKLWTFYLDATYWDYFTLTKSKMIMFWKYILQTIFRIKEVIMSQKIMQNQYIVQNITLFLLKSTTFLTLLND